MRPLLICACGAALLLAGAAGGFAQTQNQTPAASPPATAQKPPKVEESAPADPGVDEDAGTDDAGGADDQQAPIPFEGGTLTITQQEEYGEKVLAYDGQELARNYAVFFERIVKVGGVNVALVAVGDGGNQCGPAELIVWKPEGGAIQSLMVEQDECGAPPAAVADNAIYFVPYLLPGAEAQALQWSPQDGLTTSGWLTYMPEPGTGWADVDPAKYDNIVAAFHNEAVYKAAQKLLGDRLTDVATGLLVGGGTESTASGAFYASGCVPHACGSSDAFMAIDVNRKALYFAQQGEKPQPDAWPPLKTWPKDLRGAMQAALGGQ